MLYICIKTEFRKLKGSFVWLACFVIPIIPAILGTANYMGNLGILTSEWDSLWTQQTLFYGCFFFAPLIAVYCAYLWRVENFGHNRNVLMTSPVPLSCIFLGKLAVTALVTVITQLWVYVLFFVGGKVAGLPGFPPFRNFWWDMRAIPGGIACAAAILLLSMCIKSFAVPIGLSLGLSFIGFFFTNKGWGIYFPFSLITYGMNSNSADDKLSGSLALFFIVCVSYIALFSAIAVYLMRTRDVKA